MQNARTICYSHSGVRMRSRTSSPTSTASESGRNPQQTPLDHRETSGREASREMDSSHSRESVLILGASAANRAEHSKHAIQESEANQNPDDPQGSASPHARDDEIAPAALQPRRAASVPTPKPLRSALASTLLCTSNGEADCKRAKRARFDDDLLPSHALLRRALTEPTLDRRQAVSAKLLSEVGMFTDASSLDNVEVGIEDDEVEATLAVFEEVIDELAQLEDERGQAGEELAGVALKVAEALVGSESKGGECHEKGPPMTTDEVSVHHARDQDDGSDCTEDNEDSRLWSPRQIQRAAGSCPMDSMQERASKQKTAEDARQNSSSSGAETVIGPRNRNTLILPERRGSDFQTSSHKVARSPTIRHYASESVLNSTSGHLKASPAGCAVTACSVRPVEKPRINAVYGHPKAAQQRHFLNRIGSQTAQAVSSDAGTFQVLWEDSSSSSSSVLTMLDDGDEVNWLPLNAPETALSPTVNPMDTVKTKLAAWSWARENHLVHDEGIRQWIPLLAFENDDLRTKSGSQNTPTESPAGPPNTARPSVASSAKQSTPRTPHSEFEIEADDESSDDGDEQPLELQVKQLLARTSRGKSHEILRDRIHPVIEQTRSLPSTPASSRYKGLITRQLSNLAAEESHFVGHRDSLILLRKKGCEDHAQLNQQLMSSQDSMIFTRYKYDVRYPQPAVSPGPTWVRNRELSTIQDVSPPASQDKSTFLAKAEISNLTEHSDHSKSKPDEAHPDELVGCSVQERQ